MIETIKIIDAGVDMFEKLWPVVLLIAGGVGAFLRWKFTRKQSTSLLYEELEKLKQKVIKQVGREVEISATAAVQRAQLEELKRHCPECYERVIKMLLH
jgi:hypothetical protein